MPEEITLEPNWERTCRWFATNLAEKGFEDNSYFVVASFMEQVRYLFHTDPAALNRIIEELNTKSKPDRRGSIVLSSVTCFYCGEEDNHAEDCVWNTEKVSDFSEYLTEPEDQTDEEAEALEMSRFCSICGYAWSVHFDFSVSPPNDLSMCPNYGMRL